MTGFVFRGEFAKLAKKEIAKYPAKHRQSAIKSLLRLAQLQNSETYCLTKEAVAHVAELLDMPVIRAMEVAAFYNEFRLSPAGKYRLGVCSTVPCWLSGANELLEALAKHLKLTENGQTTEDGMFTLDEAECLGACTGAPILRINDEYFERISATRAIELIDDLRRGEKLPAGRRYD